MRLKSRVVHSPEKLKQVIAEMNRSLLEDKQLIVTSEKKSRELAARIDSMLAIEQVKKNAMGRDLILTDIFLTKRILLLVTN